MNSHIIEYINKRIETNKQMLKSISNPSSIIMVENAITELEGVLEIAILVNSKDIEPKVEK